MRAIDADVLYTKMKRGAYFLHGGSPSISRDVALGRIASTPTLTLDDLRPKGRWNPLPEDDREQMVGNQCSLCDYEYFGSRFNFCPSCGADMRGDDSDETD